MENQISTSIQYQLTNVKLFTEIYTNWNQFNEHLNQGPIHMKQYLLEEWNTLKNALKENQNMILKDFDKEVTTDDFDIIFNKSRNNIPVFYFTFPDYEYTDAASKYVALALTPNIPRFFTLEYSKSILTNTPQYVIGEFVIQDGKKSHLNYGSFETNRMEPFAGFVLDLLEKVENNEK